ncbi:hypothetical protein A5724_20665 [Mycobacterium sp. ACS1612]|uniref:colicin immunity domain-containing protein n=1 Tax=Mycobacterium sp. ACS1612 TaxID=1834117 RepID=UPI0008021DF6|nr:colicin immunity domain-containing protein [Mycobacterium sp. ACS1612]OBF33035.1 hypothetical protein A5724_20665 [Mycobacterium sp. ACS1612]
MPDISLYLDLIDRFIGREISASEFEKSFLHAMKSETRILGDPVYPILRDLVNELSWLKGSSYLIIVDSAQHLLTESPEDFPLLLQILDTHAEWRAITTDFGERGRFPIAFQTVFACQPEAVEGFKKRLTDANASFTVLHGD